MRLKYKYALEIFICIFSKLNSQSFEFYESKNYFLVNAGLVFNQPTLQNKVDGIERLTSNDVNFSLSLFTFCNNKRQHGWQFRVAGGTQSIRYKIKDNNGYYNTTSTYSGGDGNYSLNINKTYNFNLSKKINTLISLGPILFLNRHTNLTDSIKQVSYSDFIAYNTNPFGFGLYTAVNTVFYISHKIKFVVSLSYQRGFVNFREARVLNSAKTNEAILNYYGSGASVMLGFIYNFSKKEKSDSTID